MREHDLVEPTSLCLWSCYRWKLTANSIKTCVASSNEPTLYLYCVNVSLSRDPFVRCLLHEECGQGFLMVLASGLS